MGYGQHGGCGLGLFYSWRLGRDECISLSPTVFYYSLYAWSMCVDGNIILNEQIERSYASRSRSHGGMFAHRYSLGPTHYLLKKGRRRQSKASKKLLYLSTVPLKGSQPGATRRHWQHGFPDDQSKTGLIRPYR